LGLCIVIIGSFGWIFVFFQQKSRQNELKTNYSDFSFFRFFQILVKTPNLSRLHKLHPTLDKATFSLVKANADMKGFKNSPGDYESIQPVTR